ncbi:hypothetical protein ENSA7_51890 [Enhygromyxa salina]|uniref:Uncharacterized protein n=2 Tax=Enhygromyxa salina TaxID=215803 RepID=A0A2S9YFK8_9BACT|nr:hypothetical protein ENSA7_51890 [Enhygromyxa salina]
MQLLILGVCVGTVTGCERATPVSPTAAPKLAPIPEQTHQAEHEPEPEPEPELAPLDDETQLHALALACEGAALREQLAARTPAQLDSLADTAPPSVAMLAAWERGRSFDASGVLARASVDRLAQQIEAQLDLAPPRWWLEQLASARLREGDESGPPYYDIGLSEHADRRGAWAQGPGGLRVRPGAAMVLSAAKGTLSFDLSMGRVQLGPLPTDPGAALELARARGGTTIYYATFAPGSGGFRFPLRAIDSDSSVRWEAEVCGPDRKVLGGLGYLAVEIIVIESPPSDPDSRALPGRAATVTGIAVFSAESHGVALDVFDPNTGARTLAWSSDFWFAR